MNKFTFLSPFLPAGYPSSVSRPYLGYSSWQMGASIASSLNMVLATQSLLFAIGLGAGSIPMAAALNWIIKDGLGQVGGVLYASMVNNKFDADPKRWRMVSALALDGAIALEIATPLFPTHFLLLASIANIGKNVAWLSASATRANMHQSFSKVGNLADVTAKAGSQSIAASILGTALGVVMSPILGSDPACISIAFVGLSSIHLGCVYQSLRIVEIPTLNDQRLDGVLQLYATSSSSIASLETVGLDEKFIGRQYNSPIILNLPMHKVFPNKETLLPICELLQNEKYLVNVITQPFQKTAKVALLFEKEASSNDLLRAYFHAYSLHTYLQQSRLEDATAILQAITSTYHPDAAATFVDQMANSEWQDVNLLLEISHSARYWFPQQQQESSQSPLDG